MAIHYATEGLSVRSGDTIALSKTLHCWKFSGFSTVTALRGPTERSIFLTMTATMMTGSLAGYVCHRASYKLLYLLTLRGYSVLSSDKLWHKENKNRGHERMSI